jgi:hypothetical protein
MRRIGSVAAPLPLYSFCAQGVPCNDGANPEAALGHGADGDLYGTTPGGGAYRWGSACARRITGVDSQATPIWASTPMPTGPGEGKPGILDGTASDYRDARAPLP